MAGTPADKNQDIKGPFGLEAAIASCQLKGAQMTPLRRQTLAALLSAGRPLGAYDVRNILETELGRPVAAASIYRTLNFLCEQGVAARIESRNAYVACAHPDHDHICVFLLCDECGDVFEVESHRLERLVNDHAKRHGFAVQHQVVELSGRCAPCRA